MWRFDEKEALVDVDVSRSVYSRLKSEKIRSEALVEPNIRIDKFLLGTQEAKCSIHK